MEKYLSLIHICEYVALNALKRVAATTAEGTPAHEHVTYPVSYTHLDVYKRQEYLYLSKISKNRNG